MKVMKLSAVLVAATVSLSAVLSFAALHLTASPDRHSIDAPELFEPVEECGIREGDIAEPGLAPAPAVEPKTID